VRKFFAAPFYAHADLGKSAYGKVGTRATSGSKNPRQNMQVPGF